MTVIQFFRSSPQADGSTAPATGKIRFRPSRALVVEGSPDEVITPAPFTVAFVAGLAEVTLEPTSAGWAWRVDESVDGIRDLTYFLAVPNVPGPLDDTDLVRVNPGTLSPSAAPVAAWWPVANATVTDASIVGDSLILMRHDGTTVDAGIVRPTTEELNTAAAAAIPAGAAFLFIDTDGRPYFT